MAFGSRSRDNKRRDEKKRNTQSLLFRRKRFCRFTAQGATDVDYKDLNVLKDFLSETGKIVPARMTGTSAFFQRRVSIALRRARFLALLPYCDRHSLA